MEKKILRRNKGLFCIFVEIFNNIRIYFWKYKIDVSSVMFDGENRI